jgi:hypothetical protein
MLFCRILSVQENLASGVQSFNQPSPSSLLPSSQSSLPTLIPSPQVDVQTSKVVGVPGLHDQPLIDPDQSDFQPSPSKLFPSSQSSVPALIPSPQVVEQLVAGLIFTSVVQENPTSIIKQELLQPSKSFVFPSSQTSPETRIPSPQMLFQDEAVE